MNSKAQTEEERAYFKYLEVCSRLNAYPRKPHQSDWVKDQNQLAAVKGRLQFCETQIAEIWEFCKSGRLIKNDPRNTRRVKAHNEHLNQILSLTDGLCFYCNIPLNGEMTVDHFVPLAKGGRGTMQNKVPSCYRCNHAKGDRMPTAHETEKLAGLHLRRDISHGRKTAKRK